MLCLLLGMSIFLWLVKEAALVRKVGVARGSQSLCDASGAEDIVNS